MGREIRRVPKDWEHPRGDNGNYKPMYDSAYQEAAADWAKEFREWQDGTHKHFCKYPESKTLYYWEWCGSPPDEEYHRPSFSAEATHYQVYETVTEGTPDSPVFETKDELTDWLVSEGHSRAAAEGFAKAEWAPSMTFSSATGVVMGIDSMERLEGS